MNYRIEQQNGQTYLEIPPGSPIKITGERDAVDLIGYCSEAETNRVLLHEQNLSEDFFHLSTGVAGGILLKFANYRLKVALVLSPDRVQQGKFRDMVLETNRGNAFRVYYDREEAVAWLVEDRNPAGSRKPAG